MFRPSLAFMKVLKTSNEISVNPTSPYYRTSLYGLDESDFLGPLNYDTDLNKDLREIGGFSELYGEYIPTVPLTSPFRASIIIPILEKHGYEFHHASKYILAADSNRPETVEVVWEFMKKV